MARARKLTKPVVEIKYLKDHPEFIRTIAGWIDARWRFLHPTLTIDDLVVALKKNLNTNRVPLTLVAVENDRIVGMVGLEEFDMDTRMQYSPWLVSLYVVPELRGTGLAQRLVERVTEKARELKVKTLYLFTLKFHQGFYESRGWKILEKTVYKDHPVTILAIDLNPVRT